MEFFLFSHSFFVKFFSFLVWWCYICVGFLILQKVSITIALYCELKQLN